MNLILGSPSLLTYRNSAKVFFRSFSLSALLGGSIIPCESKPLSPASLTVSATLSMKKYMSTKHVVPVRIISRHPSNAPEYTMSGVNRFSSGQIFCSSHSFNSKSIHQVHNQTIEEYGARDFEYGAERCQWFMHSGHLPSEVIGLLRHLGPSFYLYDVIR